MHQPATENQQPATNNQQPAPDDSFHEDAFATPPTLRPLRRETMASLLYDLAKHHGVKPSPGTPEDRKPTPAKPPFIPQPATNNQ